MSSLKKTIQINPALFSLSKTRKNHGSTPREKKVAPLISPNQLKTQLLRRIKEHKNKEIESSQKEREREKEKEREREKQSRGGSSNNANNKNTATSPKDIGAYTDEFEESLNYLKSLSNRKEEMQRKTLKNYSSMFSSKRESSSSSLEPRVDINLPESLQEVVVSNPYVEPIRLNYKVEDGVPYGVLKGGVKPTYRNFMRTQKNYSPIISTPSSSNNLTFTSSSTIAPSSSLTPSLTIDTSPSSSRYDLLKEKINERKQDLQERQPMEKMIMTQSLIRKPIEMREESQEAEREENGDREEKTGREENGNREEQVHFSPVEIPQSKLELQTEIVKTVLPPIHSYAQPTKRFLKRTVRRKYTLGKSKLKKTVGILIKDRDTRKRVLTAQKELKRTTIHDVKKYLRDHNLIRAGSNTPNDVVRKIYETAMLAGDITNYNKEMLMHNLVGEPTVPL